MKRPGKPTDRSPQDLRPATLAWFEKTLKDFVLEPHHARLLRLAAEAWDRYEQAHELLAERGVTVTDRFGTERAHPAVRIECDSRDAYVRCMRELQLDVESPPAESRPPALRGRRGLRAVTS